MQTTLKTGLLRRIGAEAVWLFWGFLLLIAGAETLIAFVSPQYGLALHSLLLVGLLLFCAIAPRESDSNLALSLTLMPLTRIISLAMPVTEFSRSLWYLAASLPLLVAAWLIIRHIGLTRRQLGIRPGNVLVQLMLMGGGLILGVISYNLLTPEPMSGNPPLSAFVLPIIILMLCTGFGEELIFRGVLQSTATPVLNRLTVLYVAIIYSVMHIGHLSLENALFIFAIGLVVGQVVRWSGSIFGVSLAHGLANVSMFLIMPYIAAQPRSVVAQTFPQVVWGGAALSVLAIVILAVQAAIRARRGLPTPEPQPTSRPVPVTTPLPQPDLAAQYPTWEPQPAQRSVAPTQPFVQPQPAQRPVAPTQPLPQSQPTQQTARQPQRPVAPTQPFQQPQPAQQAPWQAQPAQQAPRTPVAPQPEPRPAQSAPQPSRQPAQPSLRFGRSQAQAAPREQPAQPANAAHASTRPPQPTSQPNARPPQPGARPQQPPPQPNARVTQPLPQTDAPRTTRRAPQAPPAAAATPHAPQANGRNTRPPAVDISNLRAMRRKSGLTYTDVAQRTGIPARLLAEIEYGLRLPDPEQLRWIVQALSLDANPQPALDPSGA